MSFKAKDKVRVKATGEQTVVDGVGTIVPPIWCENGSGYFAKELEIVEEAVDEDDVALVQAVNMNRTGNH